MSLNNIIQSVENKLMELDPKHPMSIKYLKTLQHYNKITTNQYNLAVQMTKLMYIIMSVDVKPLLPGADINDVDAVVSFHDLAAKVLGIEVPMVLKMSLDDVIGLINEYEKLQQELIRLG